jgi:predicted hydrocarbon binding protein
MIDNIFLQGAKRHAKFTWDSLGDIEEGRGDLGPDMPVKVYRLMQYTMLSVLSDAFGEEKANEYFKEAGFLAGTEYAKNVLNLKLVWGEFMSDLQAKFKEDKISIVRLEEYDPDSGDITVCAYQDLDCSGIPVTNETVCYYDEGFIAGILSEYLGKSYDVKEVDCWANGNRVCRFKGGIKK